jgi:hypothetical protein
MSAHFTNEWMEGRRTDFLASMFHVATSVEMKNAGRYNSRILGAHGNYRIERCMQTTGVRTENAEVVYRKHKFTPSFVNQGLFWYPVLLNSMYV